MDLYFNYSMDCEHPVQCVSGRCVAPAVAAASVRQFVGLMAETGMAAGTTLFVYPDTARLQPVLYAGMAAAGVEIALHLDGRRFSRLAGDQGKWMGAMSIDQQREALRLAKADLEAVINRPVTGYRACGASANNDTYPLCEELGFTWTSTSVPDLHRPKTSTCWSGAWRYAHHPSAANRLICGALRLYEMPLTTALPVGHGPSARLPFDLRAETPPALAGPDGEAFRVIIEQNIAEMIRRDQPVCGLVAGTHNTVLLAPASSSCRRHLLAVCRIAGESADAAGLRLTPASFETVRRKAMEQMAF